MSTSDVILFTTVLICTVIDLKVEAQIGGNIFLTSEINVEPSPIVPVVFTMENVNAPRVTFVEIESTRPLPVDRTKLPTNFDLTTNSVDELTPDSAFTIKPTPNLGHIILTSEVGAIDRNARAIKPTRVVSSGNFGPYTKS